MKKIILSILVLALVGFVSCKKDNPNSVKYVNAIAGVITAQDNDLKASPVGADRVWEVYKKVGTTWVPVDGSEFIPGSAANLDWVQHPFPQTFDLNSDVHIDYCPVMPLRFVTKTRLNNENKSVAYLGIYDITPDKASFPICIKGRRLGDVLTVNVDNLRSTPGYNFKVVVEYYTADICVNTCAMLSPPTTTDWPTLGFKPDNYNVLHSFEVANSGNVTVYDGVEKKILGTITIRITDPGNGINIVKTIDALCAGKGLALTIKTSKGGCDAAKLCIEDKDIVIEQCQINIDDGQVCPPAIVPTIIATDPANNSVNVALNKTVSAIFSIPMDPTTIVSPLTTFTLMNGTTSVPGTVSYSGTTAYFVPNSNLLPGTTYTATITTAAKSVQGTPMASNYVWSFTTQPTIPPAIDLGAMGQFGAFGGSAGITNQGLNTIINNGGIGTTAASTLITGFHDGITGDVYTETPLNVGNSTGGVFTAPPAPGTAAKAAIVTQALIDANAAYVSISPAGKPGGIDPGAGELGGLTLGPGVYKSASGTFNISTGPLTLDAHGDPNATWYFQTAAGLTVGIAGPAGARSVILTNGAQAKNVYWYVGSAATINGAGGGTMVGNIIATAGITFSTAGVATQTVLNGRAISLVASVTMVNTTINVPN